MMTSTYTVVGTDSSGYCSDTATVQVRISAGCAPDVYLPNAFTPNGDGTNDLFGVILTGDFALEYFRIYSRWGQLVFETADPLQAWDGRFRSQEQPVGVYTFVVNGAAIGVEPVTISGNVTLIR
jgi:gliding motility-associated-like protein